jgi:beta-aspartyl-peptidase (threonine type)
MTNKKWGRVGDSPVIGAGTYADERCGVSGTGWGEFYIRAAVAHDICARVAYRGDSLAEAAEAVVNKTVPDMGGDGGAIALDAQGNIAMPFNTSGMYRAWVRPDGSRGTAIFRDEDRTQSPSR